MPSSLSSLARKRVVVLPDAYIDALLRLPPWKKMFPQMAKIVKNGGGNIPVGPVEFKLGGNAANMAIALARLGANVDLITKTDALGQFFLERAAKGIKLNIEPVEVGPAASATLALEFEGANLMLSHSGPVHDFGPNKLRRHHWKLIDEADAVVIVNWAQNFQGTHLLKAVANRAQRHDGFVYTDTGDPRHRGPAAARDLIRQRKVWDHIDAWGLNENEVRAFSGDKKGPLLTVAKELSTRIKGHLDVHTRGWAASIHEGRLVKVPALPDTPKRLTGAGDAWNAGNLSGYLLGWDAKERIAFAHTVATKYVTGASGLPPTPKELAN
ncbi:MAG TPA: carbohydrate kinase family protein [Candidatus Thermoplasmatota archaeon]